MFAFYSSSSLLLALDLAVAKFLYPWATSWAGISTATVFSRFSLCSCSSPDTAHVFVNSLFLTFFSSNTFACTIYFFQAPDQTGTHPVKVTLWVTKLDAEWGPPVGGITPTVGAKKKTGFIHSTVLSRSLLSRCKRSLWSVGGKGKSTITNGGNSRCEGKEATNSFFFSRASVV